VGKEPYSDTSAPGGITGRGPTSTTSPTACTVKNFDWVYDNFIGEGTRRNVYHRKEAEPSGIAAAGMPPASTSSRLFSSQSMKAWSVQLGSSLKEVSPPSSTDCDQMDNFLFGVS
jgi:hypothetical protein